MLSIPTRPRGSGREDVDLEDVVADYTFLKCRIVNELMNLQKVFDN